MKHYTITILGSVVGTGFPNAANSQAEVLGITGVAREAGDRVVIDAEAPEERLTQFVEWCWQGPERASVADVKYDEGPVQGYHGFTVGTGNDLPLSGAVDKEVE